MSWLPLAPGVLDQLSRGCRSFRASAPQQCFKARAGRACLAASDQAVQQVAARRADDRSGAAVVTDFDRLPRFDPPQDLPAAIAHLPVRYPFHVAQRSTVAFVVTFSSSTIAGSGVKIWLQCERCSKSDCAGDTHTPLPRALPAAVRGAATLRQTHGPERLAMREIILNLRTADGEPRFGQADLDGLYVAQEAIFRRRQTDGDFREDLYPRLLAVTDQGAVDSMLGYLDAYPASDSDHHADTVASILISGIGQPEPPI